MKQNFIVLFLFGVFLNSCAFPGVAEIKAYQKNLKEEWTNPETTPLKEDEKAGFKGIKFFPISQKYIVTADFQPIENGRTLPFPTSANKTKYYKEYGILHFTLDNQELELTIYQSDPPIKDYEYSLFVPFKDETSGDTSYGGGRYLDFEISDIVNGKLIIDFNKAYNPYCAYSKYYNCPIPPANNYLPVEIKAGVRY